MVALVIAFSLSIQNATATGTIFNKKTKGVQEVGNHYEVTAKIIDAENRTPLVFATIRVVGSNIATVTNIDGEFTIKIPKTITKPKLETSYLGYDNLIIGLEDFSKRKNTLKMKAAKIALDQVIVRPLDGPEIIAGVLDNIKTNYSNSPNLMTGFYRESVKKNRSYVAISEAVLEIYKMPYSAFRNDMIKLYKGRKSTDVKKMDTLLFKLQGGPTTALFLDIMKNPHYLLTDDYRQFYNFDIKNIISIDNQANYVLEFNQKENIKDALYKGKLYIDVDKLAITGAEFSLNLDNISAATNLFVRKKPMGAKVIPTQAKYLVKYVKDNDKWYFNYARGEVKFKVDWNKKLFHSTFSTMSEMVITDRTSENVESFDFKSRLKPRDVIIDKVTYFTDDNYWGDYNYIEPDQSIESAIKKLNRKLKRKSK